MDTFEPGFVENLTFHTSETGEITGGFLINTMLKNKKQQDVSIENTDSKYSGGGEAKFENLGVPPGLFHETLPPCIQNQKIKEMQGGVIEDRLFDKLFHNVATAKMHNKTQKNKSSANNTRRS